MPTIKALNGSNLADFVSDDRLFDMADLNDLGITDDLTPGVMLSLPNGVTQANLYDEVMPLSPSPVITKALNGQTWVDLVLQELGDEMRLFELCDLNDAGITDDLLAGAVIDCPDYESVKRNIVSTLRASKPASASYLTLGPGEPLEEGIEFWAIEYDFIVS